nr:M15 family metallopeptidase [uncultured Niameybacter sp.]
MVDICRDLNELHPKVKELAEALLDACKKQGINISISETYRSVERQDYLYAQGRTRAGTIVTNAKGSNMSSYHQWRLAFDVFQNIKGAEYDKTILARVGAIGQNLGLEWGGSWSKFADTPHFQYTFGLSIADLKSGKKPQIYKKDVPLSIAKEQIIDRDYEEAINQLIKIGLINTQVGWIPNPDTRYIDSMIEKLAVKIIQANYGEQIDLLKDKRIISEVEKWKTKTYKEEDIKWLVKKAVQLLKD